MPSFRSVYEPLLSLYPKQYRKRYGTQILQTIEDMLDNEPRVMRRMAIWAKEIIVLPGNAFEQHMAAVARRGNLTPNMLAGLIALGLLVPFFIAMALDEMSERFYSQHLYGSWFWSKPILTVWIIALPMLSLFTSLVTWGVLALRASAKRGRVTLQVKKLWLVITLAFVSSGVLFIVVLHNGFRCWTGHVTGLNQAVQCTENIFLSTDRK